MAIIFTERSEQIDRAGYEAWHEYQRTHNGDTPDHSESFQMGAEWADRNHWRKMENCVPQDKECVLISTHDGLQLAEYDKEYKIFTDAHGLGEIVQCSGVIAWMRVPVLEQKGRTMIEKTTMYQAVCDGCQRKGVGEELIAWDCAEGAELEALDSGWQWLNGKLYCPDCAAAAGELASEEVEP